MFNNFSPRLGFTYDIDGNGKTIARANYAMYWGRSAPAASPSQINPVTRVSIRYPWVDTNHDKFVQPGEIIIPGGNIANYLGADRQLGSGQLRARRRPRTRSIRT